MAGDAILYELKDFKNLKNSLFYREVLTFFKKMVIMHRKCEFSKIKRSICNIA